MIEINHSLQQSMSWFVVTLKVAVTVSRYQLDTQVLKAPAGYGRVKRLFELAPLEVPKW